MKLFAPARFMMLSSAAVAALLALASPAQTQGFTGEQLPLAQPRPSVRVLLEGIVLDPDGTPAVGAVVVSSAGGRAVTDQDGLYRLEVEAPLEAESVQVMAVAAAKASGGSLTASAGVGPLGAARLGVVPLVLAPSSIDPSWVTTFGGAPPDNPTTEIRAVVVFDDGNGPALYAGGIFVFTPAGGAEASRIAKWDGSRWSALGSGTNASVDSLCVFDDGSGPALYAGGAFTTAGGATAKHIAKWDGSSWSALGQGIGGLTVTALAVFNDGSGPALHAGGVFVSAGGVPAFGIARWNGSSWSALGNTQNLRVSTLAVFDDGSGPALYAGGSFEAVGSVAASRIARWNGSSWSAVGSGMTGGSSTKVTDLRAFDDGSGPALYATGTFDLAGGVVAPNIARWNGSGWSRVGSGTMNPGAALVVFDSGGGPALHALGYFKPQGGSLTDSILRWDGSSWSRLFWSYLPVLDVVEFDDGSGPALFAASTSSGRGTVDDGDDAIAKWDGSNWSALRHEEAGNGMDLNEAVRALAPFDDGRGPALHAAGDFWTAGGVAANGIARWNGSTWSALGSGVNGVRCLAVFDDGTGPALYAGGSFTSAGGVAARQVAKWDGSSWSAVGGGPNFGTLPAITKAMTVFDDGSGPKLYAATEFTSSGGSYARVQRWDGTSWTKVQGGHGFKVYRYDAMVGFDDGSGPALYVSGAFRNPFETDHKHLSKWTASSGWSGGIGGVTGDIWDLEAFDDGSGPALYARGSFFQAVGSPRGIGKWNGSSWSAVGSHPPGSNWTSSVGAATVFDDGSGPALFVWGGFRDEVAGVGDYRVEKWNGSSWSSLGGRFDLYPGSPNLNALVGFDDGSGPALFAGGRFAVSDSRDRHLAKWGYPLPDVSAELDIKPGLCPNTVNPGGNSLLSVALVGSPSFDVSVVDVATLRLSRVDGIGGSVAPLADAAGLHPVIADVATPFAGSACSCHALGGDGVPDLSMQFDMKVVAGSLRLADLPDGTQATLALTGLLLDGSSLRASDCIRRVPSATSARVHVSSRAHGAFIGVSPDDESNDGGGFDSFLRTYPPGTIVHFRAPVHHEGLEFAGWAVTQERVAGVPTTAYVPAGELQLHSLQGDNSVVAMFKRVPSTNR